MNKATDEKCNGFTNWETWALVVYIENTEKLYRLVDVEYFASDYALEEFILDLITAEDIGTRGFDKSSWEEVDWQEVLDHLEEG